MVTSVFIGLLQASANDQQIAKVQSSHQRCWEGDICRSPLGDTECMSYMLLIHEPVDQRVERGPKAGHDVYDRMLQFTSDLKKRGVLLASESLASQADAARVQMRGGRPTVLDGPFAEAKEMIGGFFLLDCGTRDEAIAIAAECPAAGWCTVEVRKIAPCYA
jgi:hypothetical protein